MQPVLPDRATLDAWYALAHGSELGDVVALPGRTLRLVAQLDVLGDAAAMDAAAFTISGEQDRYRSRQAFDYPDGRRIEDLGLCHHLGSASFLLAGLIPGRDALLLSRVLRRDLVPAHELWVNGVLVDRRERLEREPLAPWYNLPYVLPGPLLTANAARVDLRLLEHELCHFHYWLYQPEDDSPLGPVPEPVLRALPAPPPRAALLWRDESGEERRFDLSDGEVWIGRRSDCDVRIGDPRLSRRHARVFGHGGRWHLEDETSASGTYLNGQRARREALRDGDEIQCGALTLRFHLAARLPLEELRARTLGYRDRQGQPALVELGERLPEGARSIAHRGRQPRSGREVVVKRLRPDLARDPAWAARFQAASAGLLRLDHPRTARVLGMGDCLRVTEALEGETLAARLQRRGRLAPREALAIVAALCGSLAEAHDEGLVHRALTPARVFLEEDEVKCLFSTLVQVAGDDATALGGRVLGDPCFLSPEQARAEALVTPAADVFSLGTLLHTMLAGAPPFAAPEPIQVVMAVLTRPPPPLPGAPEPLSALVSAMLAKAPAARPRLAELDARCAAILAQWRDVPALIAPALRALGGGVAWIDDPNGAIDGRARFRGGVLVKGTGRDDWHFDSGATAMVVTPVNPVPEAVTLSLPDGRMLHVVGAEPFFAPRGLFQRRPLPLAELARLFERGFALPESGERRERLPSGHTLLARAVASGWHILIDGPGVAER